MRVIDTTVAIDHLRGAPPATRVLRDILEVGEEIVASEIVRLELLAGVRAREMNALEQFFQALTWTPVDESVSRMAGDLARKHRKSNVGIDDADYLIAATTLLLDATLLTTNVRHFPMLRGLRAAY